MCAVRNPLYTLATGALPGPAFEILINRTARPGSKGGP